MTFLPKRDVVLALLVVLIWSAHFAVIKIGVSQVDPLVALTLRFGLTALVFVPFMRLPDRRTTLKIVEIGILMGAMHQGLLFIGSTMLNSSSIAVLMQSQTVFAVMLGWFILKERFAWRTTLGLAISAAGLIVMLGVPDVRSSPGGFAIIMISALILSFSYIRMRQLSTVHPATFVAIINIASFPIAIVMSLIFSPSGAWAHLPDVNWPVMGAVLAYQVFIVSPSHICWQQLLARNEVAKVTCFMLLTPPLGIAISVIFMGTQITWPLILGAALVMGGLGVVVIRRVQKHREGPVALVE